MANTDNYELIAEGKTKFIYRIPQTHNVLIKSKPDVTAFNNKKHVVIEDKDKHSTATTCNCFQLLREHGLYNHYIQRVDDLTFIARELKMVPIEVVIRGRAYGSYMKRHPMAVQGMEFNPPLVELFFKDDSLDDPLMVWNAQKNCFELYGSDRPQVNAYIKDLNSQEYIPRAIQHIDKLRTTGRHVFIVLRGAWKQLGVELVDLKIEFGFDVESGNLMLGDVIDNDSWRIWPDSNPDNKMDKDIFRQIDIPTPEKLGKLKEAYAWVAKATHGFLAK